MRKDAQYRAISRIIYPRRSKDLKLGVEIQESIGMAGPEKEAPSNLETRILASTATSILPSYQVHHWFQKLISIQDVFPID